jgi:mono/diheme cytochrome c family protein
LTEVPEHLLKRSRDRRAALGLGGGDGGDAAPAAAETGAASAPSAAVAKSPATPAPVVESAPKPPPFIPPFVQASERRQRVPLWAMPVLAFLPIWGVLYAQTLSQPPVTTLSQVQSGAAIFATNCSGCHGSTGGGGAGRPLADGEVIKTFPNIVSQLEYVHLGDDGHQEVYGSPAYGNPKRDGGQHSFPFGAGGKMPVWKSLSDAQLLEVVRHERETLSGEKGDDVKVDAAGNLLWPNGKPFLNSTGVLVWDDGTPMFDKSTGALSQPVDASQTLAQIAPA